jgi:ATP adenylyltransferase
VSAERTEDGCVLCAALAQDCDGPENLIVHRDEHAALILNKYPYNNGHCMVIPHRHVVEPSELSADEARDVWALVARMADVLRGPLRAHGVNVGVNLGSASGGSIRHLHVHLVPRWSGDTNFMPVIGDTKVMVETVEDTYARFRAALADATG